MKKIIIDQLKGISHLEFTFPENNDLYLLVGANGVGKTSLLVCINRICHNLAFAEKFPATRNAPEVDCYENTSIKYLTDTVELVFKKGSQRWVSTPRKNNAAKLQQFGFPEAIFIQADSQRIDIAPDEIRQGNYTRADGYIVNTMNTIFETDRFTGLQRLKNIHGKRWATYYYVLPEGNTYYSEKRFSSGEIAILRLIERIHNANQGTLVLVDEAEMALHPRIQKNLMDYLKEKSEEKNLMIFLSTHSTTLIKATSKHNIILLKPKENGEVETICPCYPATAIGNIDFIENTIYDYIFFVEDDMARLLLKKMIEKYRQMHREYSTALLRIIPVGPYAQTAFLAKNTCQQLLGQSKVYAILDADAFDEGQQNTKFWNLYEQNKDLIYSLGCTPELWMIEKMEANDPIVKNTISDKFNCECRNLLRHPSYVACNSQNPRKLAKQKTDIVVKLLMDHSGEKADIVLDILASVLIDNLFTENDINRYIAPLFN